MSFPPDTPPDFSVIELASKCQIQDTSGAQVRFGSLFASQKVVVVFIRHFFCGLCQDYVSQLAALEAASTKLIIIGCGDFRVIEHYTQVTGFRGSIYTDSTRQLYRTLGLISKLALTPSNQQKRSYVTGRWLGIATPVLEVTSAKAPNLLGQQGPVLQLGGEFVFCPGNQCTFAHRMRHVEDHIEVVDLMEAAGVTLV
ncbi:AhpC/TSA antioxidant enzyme-domain-containing protein [Mycena filopes]|nr:AhpC/TSA antioxidant enzyme-domain-containing protein [Mycena filopes]